jgi:hypothetical protein
LTSELRLAVLPVGGLIIRNRSPDGEVEKD